MVKVSTDISLGNAFRENRDPVEGEKGLLILEDGLVLEGKSFGHPHSIAGELVFGTGMVGYPETITDPSYIGQILVMTYPLIGSYGVPDIAQWESDRIQLSGLIVSHYIDTPSHWQSKKSLGAWLKQERVPALEIKDTRLLTQHIRKHRSMLARLIFDHQDLPLYDPNSENLVQSISTREIKSEGEGDVTIALIDCGVKRTIVQALLERNARVVTVPWDYDLSNPEFDFDGVLISNGPGDPQMVGPTIYVLRALLERQKPLLGICLGHQLLALAAGGKTYKLKFGHRGQNQPCLLYDNQHRCYMTTQNHGFAVETLPAGFVPWFINANDRSNEGMKHSTLPFLSVQFHPEATPGPQDTVWIFDTFLRSIREKKGE